jgi:hypothetical protein
MADKYVGEDLVRSLPPMQLLQRASEGGDIVLQLLNKVLGQGKPVDNLQGKRNQMSEPEYRNWLLQQRQLGQQMSEQQQPMEVKPSK